MRRRGAAALVGLGVLLLAGCLPREGATAIPVPRADGPRETPMPPSGGGCFETLDQGHRSGIRDARRAVIRDLEAWRRLWAEHVAGRLPEPPLPPVDFAREMVLAFFLGEKPTSGYTATITDAQLAPDKLVVRVAVETPPPGGFLLQVLTQPHHIVKLPRSDLQVEFAIEERALDPHVPPRR